MSKQEKLIERFKTRPKDFTFEELITLLGYYGYYLDNKGKTSGSRVKFKNIYGFPSIVIHKPHVRKSLLEYQINEVMKQLKKGDLL